MNIIISFNHKSYQAKVTINFYMNYLTVFSSCPNFPNVHVSVPVLCFYACNNSRHMGLSSYYKRVSNNLTFNFFSIFSLE